MKRGFSYGSNGDDEKKRIKTSMDDIERLPRKVLHLRGFHEDIEAIDIVQYAIPFGRMRNMVFAKKTHQALLEMDTLEDAVSMVDFYNDKPAQFEGKTIYVQYSKYDEIDKELKTQHTNVVKAITAANDMIDNMDDSPSSVLRVFIDHKVYPVTLQALKQIFSKRGDVLKILILPKTQQWQALIQMSDIVAAQIAKNTLNGKNIFDGCCTLRIEYARQESVHIKYNNDKSYDYTNPNLPPGESTSNTSLFDSPPPSSMIDMLQGNKGSRGDLVETLNLESLASLSNIPNLGQLPSLERLHQAIGNLTKLANIVSNVNSNQSNYSPEASFNNRGPSQVELPPPLMVLPSGGQRSHNSSHSSAQNGRVILVSNFDRERVVADTLFILFGVYGNVQKVKILYNKKDSALIEYEEEYQARDALENLKGVVWHERPLNIVFSKYDSVKLPKDGSEEPWLTKDFVGSKLHRFRNYNSKNHRNIFPPSATLHLSNIPSSITEQYLVDQFSNYGKILSFKFSPNDKKIAWIKMGSVQSAIEALVNMHNHELTPTSHLRVSFTGYSL